MVFVVWFSCALIHVCVSEQLNEELKQNLRETMTQKYQQSAQEQVTRAVDTLQQEVRGKKSAARKLDTLPSSFITEREPLKLPMASRGPLIGRGLVSYHPIRLEICVMRASQHKSDSSHSDFS